ncbi:MAG: hypothetical protein WA238_12705, partial [Methylocella sp.]
MYFIGSCAKNFVPLIWLGRIIALHRNNAQFAVRRYIDAHVEPGRFCRFEGAGYVALLPNTRAGLGRHHKREIQSREIAQYVARRDREQRLYNGVNIRHVVVLSLPAYMATQIQKTHRVLDRNRRSPTEAALACLLFDCPLRGFKPSPLG